MTRQLQWILIGVASVVLCKMHVLLQKDLQYLKSSHFYELDIQSVSKNPYLVLMILNNFKWNAHINNTCNRGPLLDYYVETCVTGQVVSWTCLLRSLYECRCERTKGSSDEPHASSAQIAAREIWETIPRTLSELDLQTLEDSRKELWLT